MKIFSGSFINALILISFTNIILANTCGSDSKKSEPNPKSGNIFSDLLGSEKEKKESEKSQ